jgi:hypothetical protein
MDRQRHLASCRLQALLNLAMPALHFDRMLLFVDPTPLARGVAREKVEVVNYSDD